MVFILILHSNRRRRDVSNIAPTGGKVCLHGITSIQEKNRVNTTCVETRHGDWGQQRFFYNNSNMNHIIFHFVGGIKETMKRQTKSFVPPTCNRN